MLYLQRCVYIAFVLAAAMLLGCSGSKVTESVSGFIPDSVKESADRMAPDALNSSLGSTPQIVWDQWVRKGPVQVYLRPKEEPVVQPSVLFFPFMPKMDVAQGRHISRELSRMVWQNWLAQEVFPIIEFADYADYYTPERAISLARQRGADLAVGGYITNYMAGGSVSDTYVALQVEVYDTATGALIWSMAHAGMMQSELTRDYIIFSARTRLPSDPTGAIMQALSRDMAKPLLAWTEPLRREEREAEAQGGNKAF
ncbi:hypothetical protein N1030_08125 [Desulfovibrio mangrovi]|uniref:hypothetical protein n=1 Tax=Desulfovibrio mangrovi TaxID=2976983 RepID=UPI0022477222|nr:hypothetical protein [Desulfovibrio mangrovi]UZP68924.1 hypothetical protein N1030_08125 [Desulfovibrio mangrovi]